MTLKNITIADLNRALQHLVDRWGVEYGHAEAAPDVIPPETDCSELSERCFNDVLGIPLPDGSMNQLDYCRKNGVKVGYPEDLAAPLQSLDLFFLTPGASGMGHVAIVYGMLYPSAGATAMLIEARGGSKWGRVIFSPLPVVYNQFRARFAGIYRLVEIESGPMP